MSSFLIGLFSGRDEFSLMGLKGEDFLVHFLPKSLKETGKVFSVVVVFGIMLRLSRPSHGRLQPGNGSDPSTKL